MRWEKPNPFTLKRNVLLGWDWAIPTYTIDINSNKGAIKSVVIDPSDLMADVKKEDKKKKKK